MSHKDKEKNQEEGRIDHITQVITEKNQISPIQATMTDQPTTVWLNNYDRSFNDVNPTITRGKLQELLSDLQNLLSVQNSLLT